jgi:geranylgeranyl diphosphate synthase type I
MNKPMQQDSVEGIYKIYLDAIEDRLKQAVNRANTFGDTRLHDMLAYHMGWKITHRTPEVRGKRIRPLLLLLSCSAAGGDWVHALPGATAVELVHNFSLIHDDIEDHSPLRRGRKTVWKKWGIPQAINAGDAMFALAHLEVIDLSITVNATIGLQAVEILQSTCFHLTHGQYLDLSYESHHDLTVDDYWPMVEGKTAALISASTQLGALAALRDKHLSEIYRQFGHLVGLAFQIQDDLLGIWGNSSLTGKSSQSDLVTGKITLPVLFGLSREGEFSDRWSQGPITPTELPQIMRLLELEGAKSYSQNQATRLLNEALSTLEQAKPIGIAGEALRMLASSLVGRQT